MARSDQPKPYLMEIQCPRCVASLTFRARHGGRYACESCGLEIEVRHADALYDPGEAAASRHSLLCPACDEGLEFWARSGDLRTCPGCELSLEVKSGRVVYSREDAERRRSLRTAVLTDEQRGALQRRYEATTKALDQRDVRRVVARATVALDALIDSGSEVAVKRAHQAHLLRRMLDDWWNEKTSFSWTVASQLAAALAYVTNPRDLVPDAVPLAGVMDDAYVIALAVESVRPEIKRYMREQHLDPGTFGF